MAEGETINNSVPVLKKRPAWQAKRRDITKKKSNGYKAVATVRAKSESHHVEQ